MSENCELHAQHRPEPLTSEQHHLEPQAWQHFKMTGHGVEARAMEERAGGAGWLATRLYNTRTVKVAPTCHRNVHYWIVQIMHRFEQLAQVHSPEAIDEQHLAGLAMQDVRELHNMRGQVFDVATDALIMHLLNGGSLRKLVAAKLYGEA